MSDYRLSSSGSSDRPRVLVVEDEALIAMTVADYLEELGYECVGPFLEMEKALPIARTEMLDAAILDIKMREADSYELAEILASRGIPFGFATGFLHEAMPPRWSDRPYVLKPYVLENVRELLLALLP